MFDSFSSLFIVGLLAHLLADWFFQNQWQSDNKTDLLHPAAWVHGGLHFFTTWAVWPLAAAVVVATTHMLIDTRKPLVWWRTFTGQTQWRADQDEKRNAAAFHLAFWQDQAAHILVLGIVARLLS